MEQFKEISGLTNPRLGSSDPETRSGRAILALQDAADQRAVVPSVGIANGLRRLGEQILMLVAQFMPERTQMEIVGETGDREVLSFVGKSFVAQSQNEGPASLLYDIRVEVAEKPNPIEVEQRLELLLSSGVIDPRLNRDDILRALRDNDLEALDPSASDRDAADEENQAALAVSEEIFAGKLPVTANGDMSPAEVRLTRAIRVLPHEDHGVHVRTHAVFLNKVGRMLYPGVLEYFARHVREHQDEDKRSLAMALEARNELQGRVQPPGRARQQQAAPGVRRSESESYAGR